MATPIHELRNQLRLASRPLRRDTKNLIINLVMSANNEGRSNLLRDQGHPNNGTLQMQRARLDAQHHLVMALRSLESVTAAATTFLGDHGFVWRSTAKEWPVLDKQPVIVLDPDNEPTVWPAQWDAANKTFSSNGGWFEPKEVTVWMPLPDERLFVKRVYADKRAAGLSSEAIALINNLSSGDESARVALMTYVRELEENQK